MSATTPDKTLTEEVADFLATGPSAEDIARFRISAHAQSRVRDLMARQMDGTLTPDENAELDEITVLDQLFTLVHARLLAASDDPHHNGADA